jgi:hypothetical protein
MLFHAHLVLLQPPFEGRLKKLKKKNCKVYINHQHQETQKPEESFKGLKPENWPIATLFTIKTRTNTKMAKEQKKEGDKGSCRGMKSQSKALIQIKRR